MKNIKAAKASVIAVCLLTAPLAWGQAESPHADVEQQVRMMADQIAAAELKADTNALEKYMADDCTIIHGDGKLLTKAEEVEDIRSGARKYEAIKRRESKVRVYGNTVVVTSLLSIRVTVHGNPYSGDIRTTRVWAKQNGNWKTVALQVTRVPPIR